MGVLNKSISKDYIIELMTDTVLYELETQLLKTSRQRNFAILPGNFRYKQMHSMGT